jgi:hypothetical protein
MKNMFKQEQIRSSNRRRSKLSQVLAGTALALFSILVMDAIMGQGGLGFLSMDTRYKGPIFGISSEILFFASFGIGYKQRSILTSLLLLAGGSLIITFWLVAPAMGWYLYFYIVLRNIYNLQIAIGSILAGLGILRIFREDGQKNA